MLALLRVFLQLFGGALFVFGTIMLIGMRASHQAASTSDKATLIALSLASIIAGPAIIRFSRQIQMKFEPPFIPETSAPTVLYLRSFKSDVWTAKSNLDTAGVAGLVSLLFRNLPRFGSTATEEEQIATAVADLGVLVAIGRPGETFPKLGAYRRYIAHEHWQEEVQMMMQDARVILLLIGDTDGFWWELATLVRRDYLDKVVFLVPRSKDLYNDFKQRAATDLALPVPDFSEENSVGNLVGLIWFQSGKSRFETFSYWNFLSLRFDEPLVPAIRKGLAPFKAHKDFTTFSPTLASATRRIAAFLIDLVIVLTFIAVGFVLLSSVDQGLGVLLGCAVLPYFVLSDTIWGQTFGKKICKIRVVDMTAGNASLIQCFIRLIVAVFCISFPVWIINLYLIASGRRGIADRASGTKTVLCA